MFCLDCYQYSIFCLSHCDRSKTWNGWLSPAEKVGHPDAYKVWGEGLHPSHLQNFKIIWPFLGKKASNIQAKPLDYGTSAGGNMWVRDLSPPPPQKEEKLALHTYDVIQSTGKDQFIFKYYDTFSTTVILFDNMEGCSRFAWHGNIGCNMQYWFQELKGFYTV